MSVLAPIWLGMAAAVGVGLVIAHLFSTSVPPRDYLPTVRFVPEGAPLAVMRTRRVSHVALLLLRLLAVALLGFALAGAYVKRGGSPRVVLIDVSRAVRSIAEVRDSARAVASGSQLVVFDSSARRASIDALATITATSARGSLSAALVAAHQVVAKVTQGRERLELVVISPLVREEIDSATTRLLTLWPGPVRHVQVATADAPVASRVTVRSMGDDPVASALQPQIPRCARADCTDVIPSTARDQHFSVRIVRTSPTHADSLWARDSAGALVVWPADMHPSVLSRRAPVDTVSGAAAGEHVVVAAFARSHVPRPGRAVARWIDGDVAATETPLGRGCVREVAIPVDPTGDVALRSSFRGIVAALSEPCGGVRDYRSLVIPSGARNLQLASGGELQIPRAARDDPGALAIWLAALGLVVLIAEQFLRARVRATA